MALNSLLERLAEVASRGHPEWRRALAPGLAPDEIEKHLAALEGWRPADDVLELYRWANGQAEPHALWVPCTLSSLDVAVEMLAHMRASMQWPPLLPIAGGWSISLEAPLSRGGSRSGPLYLRTHEGELLRAFDGVAGMLEAAIECYERGYFWWHAEQGWMSAAQEQEDEDDEEDEAERPPPESEEVRLRHNAGAEERASLDSADALTWPVEWHDFIGFDLEAFQPRGATATVEDLVVGRVAWGVDPVIVQGIVDGMSGAGAEFRVLVSDRVQSIQVLCPGVLSVGLAVGDYFEFELERPLTAQEAGALRQAEDDADRQIRAALRGLEEKLVEFGSGEQLEESALSMADFLDTRLAGAPGAVFLAKRVALVTRGPHDEDPECEEIDPQEAWERNPWRSPDPFVPAEDIDTLARNMLAAYRNGYRLEHDMQPVDVAELDEFEPEIYERACATLETSGFRVVGDWEIANIGEIWPNHPRVAMRGLVHPDGHVAAVWTLPDRLWAAMTPPRRAPRDGVVDVVTEFDDGRVLLTTTAGDMLKHDTAQERECLPFGTRANEVLQRHLARVAQVPGAKPKVARNLREYLQQVRRRHRVERDFHNSRIPTARELIALGANPQLAERIRRAMEEIA